MKRVLLSIFAAALCGSMTASATDAAKVKVTLQTKGALKIERLAQPQTGPFPGEGMSTQPVVGWQLVNIPVKIEAMGKNDKPAYFVNALTFKAHLLIAGETKDSKPVMVSKDITYVDIPVSGNDPAKTEMSVGLFIPPSSAVRINEKGKGDLKGKLLGVALEAEFNGKACMKPTDHVFDNSIKKKLADEWWSKSMNDGGAVVCSIDETPYAAYAGNFYPAVAPSTSTGSTPAVVPSTTTTTTPETPTPVVEETTTTEPDATVTEETEDDSKSGRGSKKKNKKKTRR